MDHETILRHHLNQITHVNETDSGGRTLLHWAAAGRHESLILDLLERGANPNVEDALGRSPLQYALMGGDIVAPSCDCELFENLSALAYRDQTDGIALGVPLAEEAITDYLALRILQARLTTVSISKVTKPQEAKWGCDFLLQVQTKQKTGNSTGLYWTYAIQAKRLFPNGRYQSIWHTVNDEWQGEILARFARSRGFIPLYCFYNYSVTTNKAIPSCCLAPPNQIGISIGSFDFIDRLPRLPTPRPTFEQVNDSTYVRPFRCLTCCATVRNASLGEHPLASGQFAESSRLHRSFFFDAPPSLLSPDQSQRFSFEIGEGQDGARQFAFPRYVLVAD